jgi:dihydrofolate synthase/folylpolyglutamate synthase
MAEHLDKLGPTVNDIAWNKAGIIKPSSTVITAPQSAEVAAIIQKEVALKEATLLTVGQEIYYAQERLSFEQQEIEVTIPALEFQNFFRIQTGGLYQGLNTAVASAATLTLSNQFDNLTDFSEVVSNLRFPGRCERIAEQPQVIVDGAINRQSATQFLESVRSISSHPIVLITALPEDKDFHGLLNVLMPLCDQVIVTQAHNPVLHFSDEVLKVARGIGQEVVDQPDSFEAFKQGLQWAGSDGTIWVVGTQSLVRDALCYWNQRLDTIWLKQ